MCELHRSNRSRREFVSTGMGAAALMLGLNPDSVDRLVASHYGRAVARPHLEMAKNVARWIEASRIETDAGVTWLADPADPDSVGTTLYTHSPGVVLFLLDLYHATGETTYLDSACAGMDHLMKQRPADGELDAGLYTGMSGKLFCLTECFRASGRTEYGEGARRTLERLHNASHEVGSGVAWSPVTDIISGSAGIGLTLIYADHLGSQGHSTDLAVLAGRRLLELAQPEAGGLKWSMAPDYARLMPNFSHGTAGVAYFLASLYEVSGDRVFLDAAVAGARYLQAVARTDGDSFSVFHNEPDGLDLYYLGWCHGPPGTARLFYRLSKLTGDEDWMSWVYRAARAITLSGIPEQQTPGFWNNVSRCCGHVGIGEFMLSLYRVTEDDTYRDFAGRVTADLLRRASEDVSGVSWVQAEHRSMPEFLVAQTGYMQGGAGIGTYLLHLDALEQGTDPAIVLPDSPF
jgi:lantibiotic modifying enzyme